MGPGFRLARFRELRNNARRRNVARLLGRIRRLFRLASGRIAIIFPAMTPKSISSRVTACALALASSAVAETVRLITLAPGHFHAALVQKSTLPGVDPQVHVFAPAGPELDRHLALIEQFNTREDQPTAWKTKVHSGPDYLETLLKEKPGNLVIIYGNNARKSH